MWEIEIKNDSSNYSVYLIDWGKNGYGSAFCKYLGKSIRKAKKVAKEESERYNCKIKEIK